MNRSRGAVVLTMEAHSRRLGYRGRSAAEGLLPPALAVWAVDWCESPALIHLIQVPILHHRPRSPRGPRHQFSAVGYPPGELEYGGKTAHNYPAKGSQA